MKTIVTYIFLLFLPLLTYGVITSNSQSIIYPFAYSYNSWHKEVLNGDTYYTYLAYDSNIAVEYPQGAATRTILLELDRKKGKLDCYSDIYKTKKLKSVQLTHVDFPSKPMPLSLIITLGENGLEIRTHARLLTTIQYYPDCKTNAFLAFYFKGDETYPASERPY